MVRKCKAYLPFQLVNDSTEPDQSRDASAPCTMHSRLDLLRSAYKGGASGSLGDLKSLRPRYRMAPPDTCASPGWPRQRSELRALW